MSRYFSILLLCYCGILQAQDTTLSLDWVEISAQKELARKDTVLHHSLNLGGISELAAKENGVYIRNYGPSNIASLSVRGTEPAQNQVLYRDLNLNSAFLGQSDLSLFNTSAGNYALLKGISTLAKNSGALGGMLSFEFNPIYSDKPISSVNTLLEAGSFQTYRISAETKYSAKKIHSSSKIAYDRSKNDFKYKNEALPNAPLEKQTNAAYQRVNFTHNTAIKLQKQQDLEYGLGYFFIDREIPAALLVSSQDESQADHLGLAHFQYKLYRSKHAFRLASYYKYQNINYENIQTAFQATTKAHTAMALAEHSFYLRKNISLKSRIENQGDWIQSPDIGTTKFRNRFLLTSNFKHRISKYFSWHTNLRQEFYSKFIAPFLFNIAAQFYPLGKEKFSISVEGGRNFRAPTINDLYWIPGGNLDILPESSWGGELKSNYKLKQKKWQLNFSQQIYMYSIKNQIRWLPSNSGFWQAQNIASVLTWGYEPELSFSYTPHRNWKLQTQFFYHLNNSFESAERWQNIYVPKHQVKSVLYLKFKSFYTELSQEWSSERYTSRDNSTSLDAYALYDLALGKAFKFSEHQLLLQFRVANIGNEAYALYAGRPMPGRAFYGTINYQWK